MKIIKLKFNQYTSCLWLVISMAWLIIFPTYSQQVDQVDEQGRRGIYLVVGVTQSLKPFDNPNKSFHDPTLVATLKITEVLRGSDELLEQTFEAFTSDVRILGNTYGFTPALKVGEVCICAIVRIQGEKKKLVMVSDGPYPVGDDVLPSVKGRIENRMTDRLEDFENTLQRLRERRDHPEQYPLKKPNPNIVPQSSADPQVSLPSAVSQSLPPAPTIIATDKPKDTTIGWWIASAAAIIFAGGVWLLRQK